MNRTELTERAGLIPPTVDELDDAVRDLTIDAAAARRNAPAVPDVADRLEATADRLRALATKTRRASIRWNIDSHPNAPRIIDFTQGVQAWPGGDCGARWRLAETRNPAYLFPRVFVCTRLHDHTGRHAAGLNGRITAVWGDDR